MKKLMLLGSGELGKEFAIAAKRIGQYVIAVDSYKNAPAMSVADEFEVIDMLNGQELDKIVERHNPDFIVPEIEAIRTEHFYDYEDRGIRVVPSAKAANYTMNRKAIRDLAAEELRVKTPAFKYASDEETMKEAVEYCGYPCVVKPLMSSSGKGQSIVRGEGEITTAWQYALEGSRGDVVEVIVEAFVEFDLEITLLTVTQKDGPTLFCSPIGHRQERGDYMESWQPAEISKENLETAQSISEQVTKALGGAGIWGVEFFIAADGVYFSELSPRPHDTGMVTLAGTQNFNEFELHLRTVLGLPIAEVTQERHGASAVILAQEVGKNPVYTGLKKAASFKKSDFRIFGKPSTRLHRRMGVGLAYGNETEEMETIRQRARDVAGEIAVKPRK